MIVVNAVGFILWSALLVIDFARAKHSKPAWRLPSRAGFRWMRQACCS